MEHNAGADKAACTRHRTPDRTVAHIRLAVDGRRNSTVSNTLVVKAGRGCILHCGEPWIAARR